MLAGLGLADVTDSMAATTSAAAAAGLQGTLSCVCACVCMCVFVCVCACTFLRACVAPHIKPWPTKKQDFLKAEAY
jgi:hypothetical protein